MKAGITGTTLQWENNALLRFDRSGLRSDSASQGYSSRHGLKFPTQRLEKLNEMFKPKKVTYATMEYFDVAGQAAGQGKSMESKTLQTLKSADSLIVVLDSFSDNADPMADFNTFMGEFALNDLVIASNRLERLEKDMRSGKTEALLHEKALIDQCIVTLENGGMIRDLEFSPDDEKVLRGFQFLTRKPILIVANISEELQLAGKAKEIEDKFSGHQEYRMCGDQR